MAPGADPLAEKTATAARAGGLLPTSDVGHRASDVRFSIRPTPACATLAVVLLAVLLGAVNYQSNAAYLVLSLVLSLALVSSIHTWRNLAGVTVAAGTTEPGFAGEPLGGVLTVGAAGREAVGLECGLPGATADVVRIERLAPGASARVALVLAPRGRGVHAVGRARIATVHPFGLFRAAIDVRVELTWLVYPRPLHDAGDGADCDQLVESTGVQRAGSGDFRGHRAFSAGDPQRHVDWKAVARGRPLLIKEYGAGHGERRWLDWSRSGDGDLERRLSRLAGQVLAAEEAGVGYGLRLPGCEFAPASGPAHRHACLAALALFPGTP